MGAPHKMTKEQRAWVELQLIKGTMIQSEIAQGVGVSRARIGQIKARMQQQPHKVMPFVPRQQQDYALVEARLYVLCKLALLPEQPDWNVAYRDAWTDLIWVAKDLLLESLEQVDRQPPHKSP